MRERSLWMAYMAIRTIGFAVLFAGGYWVVAIALVLFGLAGVFEDAYDESRKPIVPARENENYWRTDANKHAAP